MDNTHIKVLIVDDSPVARDLLTFILESDPKIKVIGYAVDGLDALSKLHYLNPDVVTMDLIMPKMNGFDATKEIMKTLPVPIVIITSSYHSDEIEKSFKAIQAGALAILPKPAGPYDPNYSVMAKEIQETVLLVAGLKLMRHREPIQIATLKKKQETAILPNKIFSAEAVAIGASLGGPQAIAHILANLPDTFPIPIFIVQHISIGFVNGFVSWLKKVTHLQVTLAEDQQIAQPGWVYVAPETKDMEISSGNVISLKSPSSSTVHPSIGPLFASMAKAYGPRCIGVILTGMGRDGAAEMLQMKNAGAFTIAQDESSSIIFGMPKEAIALGAVKRILPLTEIAPTLKYLAGTKE